MERGKPQAITSSPPPPPSTRVQGQWAEETWNDQWMAHWGEGGPGGPEAVVWLGPWKYLHVYQPTHSLSFPQYHTKIRNVPSETSHTMAPFMETNLNAEMSSSSHACIYASFCLVPVWTVTESSSLLTFPPKEKIAASCYYYTPYIDHTNWKVLQSFTLFFVYIFVWF